MLGAAAQTGRLADRAAKSVVLSLTFPLPRGRGSQSVLAMGCTKPVTLSRQGRGDGRIAAGLFFVPAKPVYRLPFPVIPANAGIQFQIIAVRTTAPTLLSYIL